MAFITLAGKIRDPNSDLSIGDQIRFTQQSTTGETLPGAVSVITISVLGTYSVNLQYGLVLVEYRSAKNPNFRSLGIKTVNSNNPATSIPELLTATVPVSSADLIAFQAILADAVTAKNAAVTAEAGAVAAEATLLAEKLTTVQLIALSNSFAVGSVIDTLGYTSRGDSGAASWVKSGVTGQTASQSPAQLADGLLNDGLGNQWAVVTNGGAPTLEQFGAVTSQSLGGADTVADSYSICIAMLGWCTSNNYLGRVELGTGYYRLSQTLYVNQQLLFNGKGKNESYFHANHTNGPVIRFGQGNSGLKNMGVTGGSTRRTAAYSPLNIGVLFEGDDVPENQSGAPRLTHCILENYYIFGHGSSGVHVVGPAFTGSLNHPDVNTMKGHGISFDRGELTNRVNLITAVIGGLCNITDGRINNCGGHAIAAGSPTSNYSTPALRIVINNIEGEENGTDPAVRFYNTPVYLRGSNHVFENSGLGVAEAGGASAWVAGRNIHLTNNRSLGNYTNTYVIGSFDELPTDGIYINGFSVINPTAPLNPSVLVQRPAGETIEPRNIFIQQGEDANITKLVGTDSTMSSSDYRRVPRLFINGARPPVYKTENQVVNNSISVVDDTSLKVWLAPNEKVIFELSMEYDGDISTDLRVSLGAPSGSTLSYGPSSNSLKVSAGDVAAVQGNISGTLIFGAAVGSHRLLCIKGTCTNGATGGYISTRWAQSVAGASDTTVYSGLSYIQLTNIYS